MILDSKLKEIIYKVIYEQHSLENTYIDVSDLEKLYKIFKQSRCEFYLLKHLENIPLNKKSKIFLDLKRRASLNTFQSLNVLLTSSKLSNILNNANIDHIFLKGIHLLNMFYNDIGERPTRDIDILVKKKNINKVTQALLNENYVFNTKNNPKELNADLGYSYDIPTLVSPNGIKVEVHTQITSNLDAHGNDLYVKEFFKNKISFNDDYPHSFYLSNYDLIMHLIYHGINKQGQMLD